MFLRLLVCRLLTLILVCVSSMSSCCNLFPLRIVLLIWQSLLIFWFVPMVWSLARCVKIMLIVFVSLLRKILISHLSKRRKMNEMWLRYFRHLQAMELKGWQDEKEYLMCYAFSLLFSLVFLALFFLVPGDGAPYRLHAGFLLPIIGAAFATTASTLVSRGGDALGDAVFGSATDEQKDLMDYQYEKQKEFYDYQNEYNSPVSQKERAEDAGVNPNLIFGSGGIGSVGNSSYQMPQPTQMRTSKDFAQIGAQMTQMYSDAELQKEYAKSESATRDLKIKELQIRNDYQGLLSEFQKIRNQFEPGEARSRIDVALKKCEEYVANIYKLYQEGDEKKLNNMLNVEFAPIERMLDTFSKYYGYESAKFDFEHLSEKWNLFKTDLKSQWKLRSAQAAEASASAEEHRAGAEVKGLEAKIKGLDFTLQKETFDDRKDALLSELVKNRILNDKDRMEADRELDVLWYLKKHDAVDAASKVLEHLKKIMPDLPIFFKF